MSKRKPRKNNRIHVRYDKRLHPFCWLIKFVHLDGEPVSFVAGVCDNNGQVMPNVWAKWRTKADALKDAVERAKIWKPCSLRIHKRDGTIQEERSYGVGSESPKEG